MCQQHCISTSPARRPLLLFLHRGAWFRRGVEGLQTWSSVGAGERGMPVNELGGGEGDGRRRAVPMLAST